MYKVLEITPQYFFFLFSPNTDLIDVGAKIEQQVENVDVHVGGGGNQGESPYSVTNARINQSGFEQFTNRFEVAIAACLY